MLPCESAASSKDHPRLGGAVAVQNGFPDEALGRRYPFEDRTLVLEDGRSMHHVRMGRSGRRRPTFLLLHGSPTWSFLYRDVIAPLARHAPVVAVDHVGFGRSDHPTDPDHHTLERHIGNLEEFVEGLGLRRVVPVMHDWGGPIGLGWAARNPERVAGMVLLNTWLGPAPAPQRWTRAAAAQGPARLLHGRGDRVVDKALRQMSLASLPEDVLEGYRHPFPTPQSRVALGAFARMVPRRSDGPGWEPLERVARDLSDLEAPARILFGGQDRALGPEHAEALHRMLPNAEAPQVLPGAGHLVPEDAPGAVVERAAQFVRTL